MASVRSTTSQRQRRHADRPGPWAQFPWTFLGMAFITALFLASYQTAGTVASVDVDQRPSHSEPATR
jgi:hypothetical protein